MRAAERCCGHDGDSAIHLGEKSKCGGCRSCIYLDSRGDFYCCGCDVRVEFCRCVPGTEPQAPRSEHRGSTLHYSKGRCPRCPSCVFVFVDANGFHCCGCRLAVEQCDCNPGLFRRVLRALSVRREK